MSQSDYRIPRFSIELVEDLEDSHPVSELVGILTNPSLTDEQRLFMATKKAAQLELIWGLKAAMQEDFDDTFGGGQT
jgi:hypothetical protein